MTHEQVKRLLIQHALGGAASEALQAHLRDCAQCRRLLEAERAEARTRDAAITALVQVAIAPGLAERVARRLAESGAPAQQRPHASRTVLRWRLAWSAVGLAVVLGLPVLLGVRWSLPSGPPPTPLAPADRASAVDIPTVTEVRLAGYRPLEKMRIIVQRREDKP